MGNRVVGAPLVGVRVGTKVILDGLRLGRLEGAKLGNVDGTWLATTEG